MNGSDRIRVLVADDHRMLREALKAVLEPECEVVAQAASGEEAIALAARTRPQVVVLDIAMPGMGGLAAAHRIAKQASGVRVIVLSQYDDEEYVMEALTEARAAGYLVKNDAAGELLAAVRAVAGGKRYLSPSIAPIVLSRLGKGVSAKHGSAALSRREREVLKLIAEGATSKEIASRLGISPRTAQAHRDKLKEKLGARSTAAMVRYAIKHKLVRAD
jgi:DNA-binding NarL/FixJ family response regulator